MKDTATPALKKIVVIAHRGASAYAPENVEAAFTKALAQRADYVETDTRQTRDGHVVLLHDETLARTTDAEERFPDRAPFRVQDFTLAELKTLDFGAWFGTRKEFARQRVMTFDDLLDWAGERIGLWIETKPSEAYPDMEERMAKALTARGGKKAPPERVVLQSFSADSVQKFRRFLPDILRFQLTAARDGMDPAYLDRVKTYAHGIAPNKALVTDESVRAATARGLPVVPWTFRGDDPGAVKAEIRRALDAGVQGVITDNPDQAREAVRAKG